MKKKITPSPPTKDMVVALATKTMEYFGNPEWLKLEEVDSYFTKYEIPDEDDLREMKAIVGGVVDWDQALFHIGQLDKILPSLNCNCRYTEFKYDMWGEYLGKFLSHLCKCTWLYEYESRIAYLQVEGHLMVAPREMVQARMLYPHQYSISNAVNCLLAVAAILESANEPNCEMKVFYHPIALKVREKSDGTKGSELYMVAADANIICTKDVGIII